MDTILIIGNGFDLYHGLPTRYTDFIFWVKNWEDFKSKVEKSVSSSNPNHNIDSWDVRLGEQNHLIEDSIDDFARNYNRYAPEVFKELERIINHNPWINHFCAISTNDKWIDFENEILNVLQVFERAFIEIEQHQNKDVLPQYAINEYSREIIRKFCNQAGYLIPLNVLDAQFARKFVYLEEKKRIIRKLLAELNDLIIVLKFYLYDLVANIQLNMYSERIKKLGPVRVLSFNYTDTFRGIYGSNKVEKYHHVHGSLAENNMVLGIGDDVFDTLDYVYFQKYFQRIQKKTGNDYRKWLDPDCELAFDNEIELHIIGHSLDSVDKGILNYFIESDCTQKVYIYYHNDTAYEELVINLIRLIGKEKTIEKIGNGQIEFKKLEPAIVGNVRSFDSSAKSLSR